MESRNILSGASADVDLGQHCCRQALCCQCTRQGNKVCLFPLIWLLKLAQEVADGLLGLMYVDVVPISRYTTVSGDDSPTWTLVAASTDACDTSQMVTNRLGDSMTFKFKVGRSERAVQNSLGKPPSRARIDPVFSFAPPSYHDLRGAD